MSDLIQKHREHLQRMASKGACSVIDDDGQIYTVKRDWYLIQTKPRMERTAEEGLKEQGYDVYFPLATVDKRNKRNFKTREIEPMFPGYGFINLSRDVEKGDNFQAVKFTRGVIKLVDFGGILGIVPDELIEGLMKLEKKGRIDLGLDYKVGDEVMITRWDFEYIRAIITAKTKKDRVKVLMRIMGRDIEIDLSYQDIANVS